MSNIHAHLQEFIYKAVKLNRSILLIFAAFKVKFSTSFLFENCFTEKISFLNYLLYFSVGYVGDEGWWDTCSQSPWMSRRHMFSQSKLSGHGNRHEHQEKVSWERPIQKCGTSLKYWSVRNPGVIWLVLDSGTSPKGVQEWGYNICTCPYFGWKGIFLKKTRKDKNNLSKRGSSKKVI